MRNTIIIIVIALVVIGGGIIVFAQKMANNVEVANHNSTQHDNANTMSKEENSKPVDDQMHSDMTSEGTTELTKAGEYQDYSPAAVAAAQAAGNKVVLFFHAPWCPYCRAADTAFKSSADKIPAGIAVLKTDYDTNTELKQKYGVTYQHTFVQIDNSGEQVTKWNSGDIEMLKSQIK